MWQIYGQDHLLRQIEPSLAQGRLGHAYLLTGPPHVGKMTLALNLAQAVNCLQGPGIPCGSCTQCNRIANHLHADVRVVGVPENGEESRSSRTVIGIDDIKEVLRSVNLKCSLSPAPTSARARFWESVIQERKPFLSFRAGSQGICRS